MNATSRHIIHCQPTWHCILYGNEHLIGTLAGCGLIKVLCKVLIPSAVVVPTTEDLTWISTTRLVECTGGYKLPEGTHDMVPHSHPNLHSMHCPS